MSAIRISFALSCALRLTSRRAGKSPQARPNMKFDVKPEKISPQRHRPDRQTGHRRGHLALSSVTPGAWVMGCTSAEPGRTGVWVTVGVKVCTVKTWGGVASGGYR